MHGTWKTTGGGSGPLLAVAAVIGAAVLAGSGVLAAAVTALTEILEILLFCGLGTVAAVIAAVVLIWRRHARHAPVQEQIAAFRQARQANPAVQGPAAAAPAQHVHLHYHAAPAQPAHFPALPPRAAVPGIVLRPGSGQSRPGSREAS
jgi:hypothetical protein